MTKIQDDDDVSGSNTFHRVVGMQTTQMKRSTWHVVLTRRQ